MTEPRTWKVFGYGRRAEVISESPKTGDVVDQFGVVWMFREGAILGIRKFVKGQDEVIPHQHVDVSEVFGPDYEIYEEDSE